MDAPDAQLQPHRLVKADILSAVRTGRATFNELRLPSVYYAAVFALLGLSLLTALGLLGVSPLALPFAGGFMLVGPVLLSGYFELASRHALGRPARLSDAFRAFARAPRGLWLLALFCAFLFLIWITDAGILYSFTVGGDRLGYWLPWQPEQRADVLRFALWGSLMGSALAYIIFAVSAFSVPLIYERRAGPVQAIHASVRTVLGNFTVCLLWGLLLSTSVLLSILFIPLLLWTLPVMAYASFALYRLAFPLPTTAGGDSRA